VTSRSGGRLVLCVLSFLSGAAALVFENVWFRQTSLVFGNGVWASSLVLASFMLGLALGNAASIRLSRRLMSPWKAYAGLEATVAVTGALIVLLLPQLPAVLAAVFRDVMDVPWVLNPLRLAAAFALLCVPTTAMGFTLPVLVCALSREQARFGPALGQMYGWNTLGAVAGCLSAVALVSALGVRGAGLLAAALDGLVAVSAMAWSKWGQVGTQGADADEPHRAITAPAWRLIGAGAVSGGLLLALEVVWFRLLLLFTSGTSAVFAAMLAVVLAGIGLGGLLASAWLARDAGAFRQARAVAVLAGAMVLATYWSFEHVLGVLGWTYTHSPARVLALAVPLMAPPAIASGLLFTLQGTALEREVREGTRAAGLLALGNTLGAMLGSLAGGFVLLVALGVEATLFLLGTTYAVVAVLIPTAVESRPRRVEYAAAVLFMLPLGLFPHGQMRRLAAASVQRYWTQGAKLLLFREGLTETSAYVQYQVRGEPHYHRLVTNGFTMASTLHTSQRYMKLYVYLPVALHPAPRSALLISYGTGNTAKALTDTRELTDIHVVDISRDIVEMGRVLYPQAGSYPLDDARVKVHIEDGRYFLQTTPRRFDLITAEPPPPKHAGVVSLYSREFFDLVRQRLNDGGFVTYWLPLGALDEPDARAIVKAFCGVFADCSLWTGATTDWMLLGSRSTGRRVTAERFRRQWDDPAVGPELRRLGIELPEQLGATFLTDSAGLAEWTASAEPLVDDRPARLSPASNVVTITPRYVSLLDASASAFERSGWVRRVWPVEIREQTLPMFHYQRVYDRLFWGQIVPGYGVDTAVELHRVLSATSLQSLPLLLLGSDADLGRIAAGHAARGHVDAWLLEQLAVSALAKRRFEDAVRYASASLQLETSQPAALRCLVHSLVATGRKADAAQRLAAAPPTPARAELSRWLAASPP
jgi:spermidine synthase